MNKQLVNDVIINERGEVQGLSVPHYIKGSRVKVEAFNGRWKILTERNYGPGWNFLGYADSKAEIEDIIRMTDTTC